MSIVPRRKDKPPKLKSVSYYKKKKYKPKYYGSQQIKKTGAWRAFSLFVRKSSDRCYSCGVIISHEKAHAGHYITGNICGRSLFMSAKNVKKQCPRCNLWLHGNLPAFALSLRREYGDGILDELEAIRREEKEKGIICRFSKEELIAIEEKYKAKLNNKCKFCDELLVDYQEHECS